MRVEELDRFGAQLEMPKEAVKEQNAIMVRIGDLIMGCPCSDHQVTDRRSGPVYQAMRHGLARLPAGRVAWRHVDLNAIFAQRGRAREDIYHLIFIGMPMIQ